MAPTGGAAGAVENPAQRQGGNSIGAVLQEMRSGSCRLQSGRVPYGAAHRRAPGLGVFWRIKPSPERAELPLPGPAAPAGSRAAGAAAPHCVAARGGGHCVPPEPFCSGARAGSVSGLFVVSPPRELGAGIARGL